MKKATKTKWVKALRSGDYRQGKSVLKRSTKSLGEQYCCLGVLCEVAGLTAHKVNTEWYYAESRVQLPYELRTELGINSSEQNHLIGMNDEGNNFNTIADWIEENL